jgi:predicted transcriptional regulator
MAGQKTPQAAAAMIHTFLTEHGSFSETAASLAYKLKVDHRTVRQMLDELAEAGMLSRRTFEGKIEPVYYRYSDHRLPPESAPEGAA